MNVEYISAEYDLNKRAGFAKRMPVGYRTQSKQGGVTFDDGVPMGTSGESEKHTRGKPTRDGFSFEGGKNRRNTMTEDQIKNFV